MTDIIEALNYCRREYLNRESFVQALEQVFPKTKGTEWKWKDGMIIKLIRDG